MCLNAVIGSCQVHLQCFCHKRNTVTNLSSVFHADVLNEAHEHDGNEEFLSSAWADLQALLGAVTKEESAANSTN